MTKLAHIKYILLLALLLRLYHITAPMIGTHSWRQTDTAAMARNYFENGMNFLYPQIDWGGNSAGYVECEFPAYPYIVAVVYHVFGFSEMWGRLISLVFSLVGIYYLFRLVNEIVDTKTALWASLFAAILPLNVFYGRVFMPESAMLMSSVVGIYYFYRWKIDTTTQSLILSAFFIALACLLKLPALYLGLPLLYIAWLKYGKQVLIQVAIWLYAIVILSCVALWYYHAHQILLHGGLTFGIWEYGSDKWGNWSLVLSWKFWNGILFQSLAEKHFTWFGFIIFLIGLFLSRQSAKERLFDFWLLAIVVYFIIVAKGNYVHNYYQLPFMLPAVVYMGKVFARFLNFPNLKNWGSFGLIVSLGGIILVGGWRYSIYMGYENKENSKEIQLAEKVQALTPRGSLIVALEAFDPTILYLSNRKGWHVTSGELTKENLQQKNKLGAGYFIGLKKYSSDYLPQQLEPVIQSFKPLYNDNDMFIVDLGALENRSLL